MKTLKSVLPRAALIFLIFTIVCGVVYTGVVTGLAQLIFPDKANGNIIEVDGKKYGCELLGQQYKDDGHMWGRIMNIDVSVHNATPHMSVICILLTEQLTAVFFPVNLYNAAICFIRENDLCYPCYNTRINNTANYRENQENDSRFRQYIF